MVEFEADDALASAAAVAAADQRVEQVIICTPDKDLGQCVGGKVVQLDRRQRRAARRGRRARRSSACRPSRSPTGSRSSATPPTGSRACPGFGAKTAAALLARYGHVEAIPDDRDAWDVPGVRGAERLGGDARAGTRRSPARFKELATLRTDVPRRHASTIGSGAGRARRSAIGASDSDRRDSPSAPRSSRRRRTEQLVSDAVLVEPRPARDREGHAEPARTTQRDELRPRRAASTTRSTSSRPTAAAA